MAAPLESLYIRGIYAPLHKCPTPLILTSRSRWALDVLECPRGSGRMRIVAAVHPPDATKLELNPTHLTEDFSVNRNLP